MKLYQKIAKFPIVGNFSWRGFFSLSDFGNF